MPRFFPSQVRDTISPVCPWSALRSAAAFRHCSGLWTDDQNAVLSFHQKTSCQQSLVLNSASMWTKLTLVTTAEGGNIDTLVSWPMALQLSCLCMNLYKQSSGLSPTFPYYEQDPFCPPHPRLSIIISDLYCTSDMKPKSLQSGRYSIYWLSHKNGKEKKQTSRFSLKSCHHRSKWSTGGKSVTKGKLSYMYAASNTLPKTFCPSCFHMVDGWKAGGKEMC